MSRKQKKPDSMPSKAYLVSFGDTMTALLAFFIVLNSLAKDQTGANMHSGSGSFVNAIKSIGVPGTFTGDRSKLAIEKESPAPLYVVPNENEEQQPGNGPDDIDDQQRIINRQMEQFQRFLTEMQRQTSVEERPPTKASVVMDSWERLSPNNEDVLGNKSIQLVADAIAQIDNRNIEIDLIFWADYPSALEFKKKAKIARKAEQQIERLFRLSKDQRARIRFLTKPWLFVDSKRPIFSLVVSKMAR